VKSPPNEEGRPAANGTALEVDTEAASNALPVGSLGEGAQRRYGGSLWNAWLDAKLALDLTIEEHRLADALARNVIGFGGKTSERLGNTLLRSEARLHGRSFERARDGLAAKALIRFEKGRGRGARTLYILLIEKAADERSYPDSTSAEKTAEARPFAGHEAAEKAAEKAAQERPRITDNGEGATTSVVAPVSSDANGEEMLKPEPAVEDAALLATLRGLASPTRDRVADEWKRDGGPEIVRYCVARATAAGDSLDEATLIRYLDEPYECFLVCVQSGSDVAFEVAQRYADARSVADAYEAEGRETSIEAVKGPAAIGYLKERAA
jgi:hypothetical protein